MIRIYTKAVLAVYTIHIRLLCIDQRLDIYTLDLKDLWTRCLNFKERSYKKRMGSWILSYVVGAYPPSSSSSIIYNHWSLSDYVNLLNIPLPPTNPQLNTSLLNTKSAPLLYMT